MQFFMYANLIIILFGNFNRNNHYSNDDKHKEVQIYFVSKNNFRFYSITTNFPHDRLDSLKLVSLYI